MEGHGRGLLFIVQTAGAALLAASAAAVASQEASSQSVPAAQPEITSHQANPADASAARVQAGYSQSPLHFERNQGQTAAAVQYLARGPGYSLFLTADEAVMNLASGDGGTVLRAGLAGANPHPSFTAEEPLPGHASYFHGRDPAKWQHDVAEFGRVRLHDVYDGVDLVYYGSQQQLEYDFIVAPGADPNRIQLRYRGLQSAAVDVQGDLHLGDGNREVIEHKPVVYQMRDGQRQPVDGSFRVKQQADQTIEVAFALGAYDATQPLIIDPVLSYATFIGGSGSGGDVGYAVAVDFSGTAYIAGMTRSIDFPTTLGAYQQTAPSSWADAFVTKLSGDGSTLLFSTYLDGSDWSQANGVAVDQQGSVYVVGSTNTRDFPVTANAFQPTLNGPTNAFVAKLSLDGKQLLYSSYLGGSGYDTALAVAVDINGSAFVTGNSQSTNFPVTPGAYQTTPGEVFVSRIARDGGSLMYSTYLGGPSLGSGKGIAVDEQDNAYVTGYYSSGFPTTTLAYQKSIGSGAFYNAFVARLDASGATLVGSTYLGGSHADIGNGITLRNGNVYIAGFAGSQDFPTTSGAFQTTSHSGSGNAFVAELDGFEMNLWYSTYLGGSGYNGDQAQSIAIDGNGIAYVAGSTTSTDFPTTAAAYQRTLKGVQNAFVSELKADGSGLVYSTYLGGDAGSNGIGGDAYGIAYGNGGAVVTGATQAASFPVSPNALQGQLAGPQNGFIAKFASSTVTLSPAGLNFGRIAVGASSTAKNLTLKNGFGLPLSISSITTQTPVFTQTNNCGTSLAPNATCTISVIFAPKAAEAVVDSLQVTTSQGILNSGLNGTGSGALPKVKLSATSLNFGTVVVGTTSPPKSIRLTNSGRGPLSIHQIGLDLYSQSFAQTNNCPAYLAPAAFCTVTVTFTPDTGGGITGTLNILSNAATSPNAVSLTGTGDNGGG